jgi:hypothetical protein
MKRFLIVFIIALVLPLTLSAQNDKKGDKEHMENMARIERLEKIKLIEVLNLSEDDVMKFFARRNEYFKNNRALMDERKKITDGLEADMKSGKKNSKRYYKNLIDRIIEIDRESLKRRENFYLSLNNILTTEQIAKLMVFANRFNREILNEAFKDNKPQK